MEEDGIAFDMHNMTAVLTSKGEDGEFEKGERSGGRLITIGTMRGGPMESDRA